MNMNITEVKIRKTFETEPLKAICSVTLYGEIAIHDIKLICVGGRTVVVMPSKQRKNGEYSDIVHPINSDARKELEKAILTEYEKLFLE